MKTLSVLLLQLFIVCSFSEQLRFDSRIGSEYRRLEALDTPTKSRVFGDQIMISVWYIQKLLSGSRLFV